MDYGQLAPIGGAILVLVGLFGLRARQRRRVANATPGAGQPWSVRKSLGWAVALIVIDAFILNQGVIAALVGVWTLGVSLPRAAFTKIREEKRLGLAVSRPGYHALLSVDFPPFGRPVYHFERDTWGHLD